MLGASGKRPTVSPGTRVGLIFCFSSKKYGKISIATTPYESVGNSKFPILSLIGVFPSEKKKKKTLYRLVKMLVMTLCNVFPKYYHYRGNKRTNTNKILQSAQNRFWFAMIYQTIPYILSLKLTAFDCGLPPIVRRMSWLFLF